MLVVNGSAVLGGSMEFVSSVLGGINFELIAQRTMLALVVVAGPVIVFLLVARGGDL